MEEMKSSDVNDSKPVQRLKLWMRKALDHAEKALKRGEVPVGCLFIRGEDVVATGSNEVNETKNASRHAEMTCIDDILKMCWDEGMNFAEVFSQVDVVVTVEPCIMCASALHQMKVKSITFGAANSRFGGCRSVLDVSTIHKDSGVDVVGGVFAEEAVRLLQQFYEGTNPNAPIPKAKKLKLDCRD